MPEYLKDCRDQIWVRLLLVVLAGACHRPAQSAEPHAAVSIPDPRHIATGWVLPSQGYADQPYIIRTDDGAWLCVMTTSEAVGNYRAGCSPE